LTLKKNYLIKNVKHGREQMNLVYDDCTQFGVSCTRAYADALDDAEYASSVYAEVQDNLDGTLSERNVRIAEAYEAMCVAEARVSRLMIEGHMKRRT
jgi:hypothetical protein